MSNLKQTTLQINSLPGETDLTAILRNIARKAGPDGICTIAPGIAARIIQELNFPGNRNVKKVRVADNLRLMKSGEWEPHVSIIVFCVLPDGSLVMINGQHRLHAIAALGIPVQTKIDFIPARDDQHVRALYAKYDTRGSVRTETELVKASGIAAALEIKTRTAEILIKAVPIIMNRMEPSTRIAGKEHMNQFEFRVEHSAGWAREAADIDAICAMADAHIRKQILRAGTMAVALYTLRHCRERAFDFWSGVAENNGLRKTDPRARLIADFAIRSLATGSARQSVQQSVMAWNAFYENRELKIIKCIEGAEIVISGTPMRKGGCQ